MIGSSSPMTALAYWPIKTPALKLSVAKRASVASIGSVGVSRAMTSTPASRAFWMAGTIALVSPGVTKIPCAPAVTMFSMAAVWAALSASNAPDAVNSSAPAAAAASSAPSFILTKNGLVSVLVISPTMTCSSCAAAGCMAVRSGNALIRSASANTTRAVPACRSRRWDPKRLRIVFPLRAMTDAPARCWRAHTVWTAGLYGSPLCRSIPFRDDLASALGKLHGMVCDGLQPQPTFLFHPNDLAQNGALNSISSAP
ncbi:MAG: hypothetical protein K0Q89_3098, partial [Thermomicrobiales bacterium]|nr:hypothetical protein [Thermomicrobiales bacterium]